MIFPSEKSLMEAYLLPGVTDQELAFFERENRAPSESQGAREKFVRKIRMRGKKEG